MNLRPALLVFLPPLLAGAALRAQETPDSLFQHGVVSRSGPNTCYRLADFTIVAHELEEVGSDLFVRSRPDAGCAADSLPGDLVLRNREAEYFLGVRDSVLFVDSGTGPDARVLILVALPSGARLLQTDYVNLDAGTTSGTLRLWEPFALQAAAAGCPPPPAGLGAGVDSLRILTIRSGRLERTPLMRCAVRQ
jgi:hypothetical protein